MRFKVTIDNLTIQIETDEVDGCIRRAVRLLVPKFTSKVYLLVDPEQPIEIVEPGLVVVGPKGLPSNFLSSFRLILRHDELVVVSGQVGFTRQQWRDFAAKLAS